MNILVRVSRKRKCFASLDQEEHHWLMSFGTASRPENDVEIEFSQSQLSKLRDLLNQDLRLKHYGEC